MKLYSLLEHVQYNLLAMYVGTYSCLQLLCDFPLHLMNEFCLYKPV